MKIENWCGHEIRFVELKGEWYAVLKDICDALSLRTDAVASRLDPDMLERTAIRTSDPVSTGVTSDNPSRVVRSRARKTQFMLVVNEEGIYEALFASKRLEARKFRRWSASVMRKLRETIGLEGYQVMDMTKPEVQADIDFILDSIYYDEETGKVMRSVIVQGGDVMQVPFE